MGETDMIGEDIPVVTTPIVGEEASTRMQGEEISTGGLGEHDDPGSPAAAFGEF